MPPGGVILALYPSADLCNFTTESAAAAMCHAAGRLDRRSIALVCAADLIVPCDTQRCWAESIKRAILCRRSGMRIGKIRDGHGLRPSVGWVG